MAQFTFPLWNFIGHKQAARLEQYNNWIKKKNWMMMQTTKRRQIVESVILCCAFVGLVSQLKWKTWLCLSVLTCIQMRHHCGRNWCGFRFFYRISFPGSNVCIARTYPSWPAGIDTQQHRWDLCCFHHQLGENLAWKIWTETEFDLYVLLTEERAREGDLRISSSERRS